MESKHAPPRKPARATWSLMLLVACGLFALTAIGVGALTRLPHGRSPRTSCANHLRQLGTLATTWSLEHPGEPPPHDGPALLISYRQEGWIRREDESIFLCPSDPHVLQELTERVAAEYDTLDLTDPAAGAGRISYAVRDFTRYPLDPDSPDEQAIMCDAHPPDGTPHHRNGLNVVYDDGAVKFRDRAYFGLPPGAPIIVGPDSPLPELRVMLPPWDPDAAWPPPAIARALETNDDGSWPIYVVAGLAAAALVLIAYDLRRRWRRKTMTPMGPPSRSAPASQTPDGMRVAGTEVS